MSLKNFALPLTFAAYAVMSPVAQAALTDTIPELRPAPTAEMMAGKCRSTLSVYMDESPFASRRDDRFAPFYDCANARIVQVPCTDIFMTWTLSALNPNQERRREFMNAMYDHCQKESHDAMMITIMEDILEHTATEVAPAVGTFFIDRLTPMLHR